LSRPIPEDLKWRTSTRTGTGANCVEVGWHGGVFYIRDSKNRSGPVLTITHDDWKSFLATIRSAA
jgi:hypothetical protein